MSIKNIKASVKSEIQKEATKIKKAVADVRQYLRDSIISKHVDKSCLSIGGHGSIVSTAWASHTSSAMSSIDQANDCSSWFGWRS